MASKHPIRRFRESVGLSQAELATQLGVTATTVHRWEKGLSVPRRGQWTRLVEVTGVLPAQLAAYQPEASAA